MDKSPRHRFSRQIVSMNDAKGTKIFAKIARHQRSGHPAHYRLELRLQSNDGMTQDNIDIPAELMREGGERFLERLETLNQSFLRDVALAGDVIAKYHFVKTGEKPNPVQDTKYYKTARKLHAAIAKSTYETYKYALKAALEKETADACVEEMDAIPSPGQARYLQLARQMIAAEPSGYPYSFDEMEKDLRSLEKKAKVAFDDLRRGQAEHSRFFAGAEVNEASRERIRKEMQEIFHAEQELSEALFLLEDGWFASAAELRKNGYISVGEARDRQNAARDAIARARQSYDTLMADMEYYPPSERAGEQQNERDAEDAGETMRFILDTMENLAKDLGSSLKMRDTITMHVASKSARIR